MFFPLLRTVFELVDFDAFYCFCCFLFHSSTWAKPFPLRTFFHPGKQKKPLGVRLGEQSHRGQADHVLFGHNLLETQLSVGRCTGQSPIMKWTNGLKESSKKFTEAERSLSQHHQLLHQYRWVPRTLTSQQKPVLQGAHLPEDNSGFFGSPPYIYRSAFRNCFNPLIYFMIFTRKKHYLNYCHFENLEDLVSFLLYILINSCIYFRFFAFPYRVYDWL